MKPLLTQDAIALLQKADCVVISPTGNIPDVATFVGFAEEGDEDSAFAVGADGYDDIIIEDVEWDDEKSRMVVPGLDGHLTLYMKLKP